MSRPPSEADEIQAFLHYGFVPRVAPELAGRPWLQPGTRLPEDAETCIRAGERALEQVFADVPAGTQLVPISGGLDSRAILGMLVRAGARERVVAVTFGTPGTLDFEIGRKVARFAGVTHEAIDLTREPLDEARLRAALRPGPVWTHAFEAHGNDLVSVRFGGNALLWSGIMANVINGSRVGPPGQSWDEARRAYARGSRFSRTAVLTRPGFDPLEVLPREPLAPESRLTWAEQLHVAFHYPCRLDPVLLRPGQAYRAPFRDPRWVDFAVSVPSELRRGERLFRAVVTRVLPEWMRLPAKNMGGVAPSAPRWRARLALQWLRAGRLARRWLPGLSLGPRPGTNTLDFARELRRAGPLRDVVNELLDRLGARATVDWLDLRALRTQNERGRADHSEALILLALLELHLAARAAPAAVEPGA